MPASGKILHAGQNAKIACSPGCKICIKELLCRHHEFGSNDEEGLDSDSWSANSSMDKMKADFALV